MSDDLRLVASVTDQFTGPLAKLRKGIADVSTDTKTHVGAWRKDWGLAREEVEKFRGVLGGVSPVLSAVGMGGIGAALSLGGIVAAVRGFSASTRDLSLFAREVGLTANELRGFQALGQSFGISADRMNGAIGTFATNMDQLRHRTGALYRDLQGMGLGQLAEKLIDAPNMAEAFKRAVEGVAEIQNPQRRRDLAEKLLALPEFSAVAVELRGKLRETIEQISKDIGTLPKDMEEAAKEFEQNASRMWRWYEQGKLQIPGRALKGIVGTVDDFNANGLSGNAQEQATRKALSPFGGPATPREHLEGRRHQIERQLELLKAGPRGSDYERKRDRMTEELKRVGDELQKLRESGNASVSPSAFNSPLGGGSLIQKAAWGGMGGFPGVPGLGGGTGPLGGGVSGEPGLGGRAAGGGAEAPAGPNGNPGARSPRGRQGGGNAMPGIPEAVPMTPAERNTLGLIMKHESGGQNVMNYMGRRQGLDPNTAKGYTAQGYFQMLNSNWRRIAPLYGIKTSNAMSSSLEDQTKVALHLLRNGGIQNWSNYNPGLRAALARGDKAPVGTVPDLAEGASAPRQGDTGNSAPEQPWYERPRSNEPGKMSRVRDDEIEDPRSRKRQGDDLMLKMFPPRAAVPGGKGSLHITLDGFPSGAKARASMGDLFSNVKVSSSQQMGGT